MDNSSLKKRNQKYPDISIIKDKPMRFLNFKTKKVDHGVFGTFVRIRFNEPIYFIIIWCDLLFQLGQRC